MKGVCNLHVLLAFGVSCYWLFVCLLLSSVLILLFMLCYVYAVLMAKSLYGLRDAEKGKVLLVL